MYLGTGSLIFIVVIILYTTVGYWYLKHRVDIPSMYYSEQDSLFSILYGGYLLIFLAAGYWGVERICKEFDINNLHAILDDTIELIIVLFVLCVGALLLSLVIKLETSYKRKEDSAKGILSEIEIEKAGFDTSLSGDWQKIAERPLSQAEKSCVLRAEIVDSTDGLSCCFFLITGQRAHYPVATSSKLKVGDVVDLDKAKIITLYRFGGQITRLE